MSASPVSSPRTAPSILLIEEYDALGAAIASALKKFAPQHSVRTVESLVQAEKVASKTPPQLFIVDLDPPQPNTVEFLGRMAASFPDSRVLVIASGIPAACISERFGPNGLQFVEKPFELAEFGAAVQALLGPWTDASSGDSRGTLRDLNARDLVPIECVTNATAILRLVADSSTKGEVHFLDGQILHAVTGEIEGIEALQEILGWPKTQAEEEKRSASAPRTIKNPWDQVFLKGLREAKKPIPQQTPPPPTESPALVETKPPSRPVKDGKKIVVIDDTEMLLIFVEDVLATADSKLQISTASTGEEGVRSVATILPDLVLLDYSIPDIRGDEVCRRLLANKATASIPILMMSGHVPEMMTTAERCENVVATIAKPFMSGKLVELVQKLLTDEVRQRPVRPTKKVAPPKPAAKAPANPNPTPAAAPPKVVAPPPVEPAPSPAVAPPVAVSKKEPIKIMVPETLHASLPRDLRPAELALLDSPPVSPSPRWVRPTPAKGLVTLGLGMEVVSVQFTSRFQVDTIFARPSPSGVSLIQPSPAPGAEERLGSGFELGRAELDSDGRIKTIRVLPMRRPAGFIRGRNGFDINDVTIVNGRAFVQFTAGMTVPMTMQVTASVKVSEVELSERFEVAQLVLIPDGIRVKAVLDPQLRAGAGADFQITRVGLDRSGRITEFVFQLIASPQPL